MKNDDFLDSFLKERIGPAFVKSLKQLLNLYLCLTLFVFVAFSIGCFSVIVLGGMAFTLWAIINLPWYLLVLVSFGILLVWNIVTGKTNNTP